MEVELGLQRYRGETPAVDDGHFIDALTVRCIVEGSHGGGSDSYSFRTLHHGKMHYLLHAP